MNKVSSRKELAFGLLEIFLRSLAVIFSAITGMVVIGGMGAIFSTAFSAVGVIDKGDPGQVFLVSLALLGLIGAGVGCYIGNRFSSFCLDRLGITKSSVEK